MALLIPMSKWYAYTTRHSKIPRHHRTGTISLRFALGCFEWDIEEEAYLPALYDRLEAWM